MFKSPELVLLVALTVIAVWMDREASFVDSANLNEIAKNKPEEDDNGKKTQEDIMFGNQQTNKQNFLQTMLGMSLSPDVIENLEKAAAAEKNETDNSKEEVEKKSDDGAKKDGKDEKFVGTSIEFNEDERELPNNHPWLREPMSEEAIHYLLGHTGPQEIPQGALENPIFDAGEIYRRKRQLPIPLKKRSLRSPIGQMIQTRGRRMPRQSMRLKRQVDLGQLLSIIDNNNNNNEANEEPRFFDERMPTNEGPRESPFRFPYNFARNSDVEMEQDEDGSKDVSPNPFLYPPVSRFMETSDYSGPYNSKLEENEASPVEYPEWMERSLPHPSIFSVSRRSSPLFYPVDYRYVPGYKKRTLRKKDEGNNFGKWGRVVQTPSAYATAEDVAKLYALANMLAEEGDDSTEERIRRSE